MAALDDFADDVRAEEAINAADPNWRGNRNFWDDITGVTAAQAGAEAAEAGTMAGIEEQRRQFDLMQEILSPFVEAGVGSLEQQQAMMGLLGPEAQAAAIQGVQQSPGFQEAMKAGETSILQNAAATGGLRGGNVQSALGQFAPQMLNQALNQRFGQLGGLTGLGQASAAGVGAGAMGMGQNIGQSLQQLGQNQAANIMGQHNLQKDFIFDVAGLGLGLAGLF
jgi:hypothetical protein